MTSADDGRFADPKRVALNRIYTGHGDAGTTALVGGQKVPKDDARIDAYGTIDELNTFVGAARLALQALAAADASDEAARLAADLLRVQHQLFNLGSVLATLPEDLHPRQPRIVAEDAAWLEGEMDRMNEALPALRSFVLPGGDIAAVELHRCRTICRRAERIMVSLARAGGGVDDDALRYINRLSDAFFVWSRWVLHVQQLPEVLWQPNAASGASGHGA
jgi:cob(I)alamin adenosyltransferase